MDDTPFGGGAGMVMRIDVVCAALEAVYGTDAARVREARRVVELTPKGRQLDDALAAELAGGDLCLLCGRYEGIDERVTHVVSDRLSIGPYVLSGGEVAAMAVLDAVIRKVAGAVSNPESVTAESFAPELDGGVEYPHYTRPAEYRGWVVPEVLLSGDHAKVARLADGAGPAATDLTWRSGPAHRARATTTHHAKVARWRAEQVRRPPT